MVYLITNKTLLAFIRLWIRKVEGLKNIPADKGFVVACNHGSFFDDLTLHAALIPKINKYLHIYVNSIFFKIWFFRIVLKHGQCIPIDVGKGNRGRMTNKKAFKAAIKYLKAGEPVGIFPEGHRSYQDRMREGKTGAVKLALTARVPVVPMGIEGSREILPRNAFWPRLKRCNIRIGKPIYLDKYYGKEENKKVRKLITNDIMKNIAKLAKEKYDY